MKVKYLVGKIKNNPSKEFKDIVGMKLLLVEIGDYEDLMFINPISLEDMEKFYKVSYTNGMKDAISDDYNYCIWYMLREDCEFTCEIDRKELEDIKDAIQVDIDEYEKNIKEFKKIHKYYEFQREDEEDNLDKEMDCLVCEVGKDRACDDCCKDWENEELENE